MGRRWRNVLYGFWFLPGLVVVGIAALALVLVTVDDRLLPTGVPLLFGGSGSGARGILSVVAGATATIAGVVFSITIVTLQLVSSQYTPRTLRGFLEDRVSQVSAGVFVGTFVYCLLVLRVIREATSDGAAYVPALAVTGSIVLGVVSLGVLLLFVHHISTSMQVSTIAARAAHATLEAVEHLYPAASGSGVGEDPAAVRARWQAASRPLAVGASRSGYVQVVDLSRLTGLPPGTGVDVRVHAGDFVTAGAELALVHGAAAADARGGVADAVRVVDERDRAQDVDYGLRQLADIAVRALSPGVNDPGTAVTCIRYLGAVMRALVTRPDPAAVRRLGRDVVVIAEPRDLPAHLDSSFVAVGRYAVDDPGVAGVLLEVMGDCAGAALAVGRDGRATTILDVADDIGREALDHARLEVDRAGLARVLARLRELPAARSDGRVSHAGSGR